LGAAWEWTPYDIEGSLEENLDDEVRRRAQAAAQSGRLVRISEEPPLYVFMGEHGDHLVVGGVYCTCEAFYYSTLRGRPGCYHVYAARLGGGHARSLNLDLDTLITVVSEILNAGFSPTLRRVLYTPPSSEQPG